MNPSVRAGWCAILLAVLVASGCQVHVRRVPKPEPVATLRAAGTHRVSDRVATSNAAWSPDGRAVAFGTAEGVVVQEGESGERTVSSLRQATWVDWSSAGRWLAVVSQGNLWVVDLGTGSPRRVDLPGVVRSFRWSPSGDRGVAVVEAQGAWLWLVSAQGGLRRKLFGPVHNLYDVSWFPNGLYVFARAEDGRGRTVELWHVRVAGADRRKLASPFPLVLQAQLSPTGRAVAYLAAEEGAWAVAVQEGGRARTVARGRHLWGVSWSPQGDKLSYAEVEEGGERAAVWVVDADGSGRLQVADYALEFPDPDALVGTSWSPDGRAVVFGTGFAHRAGPVWVARLQRR
ncbi:MAG: hypothetical protein RMM30_06805 [Armatimonadota bacterium]|nr:hypothetical protein [Armatimonadota bacterium]MDW8156279.1 hypothetical protein [Armatimonadota bacterium]